MQLAQDECHCLHLYLLVSAAHWVTTHSLLDKTSPGAATGQLPARIAALSPLCQRPASPVCSKGAAAA